MVEGLTNEIVFAKVVDITGKVIYNATVTNGSIDLTNEANGLYYIRLTNLKGELLHQQSILKSN
jgi:hypothetical protein